MYCTCFWANYLPFLTILTLPGLEAEHSYLAKALAQFSQWHGRRLLVLLKCIATRSSKIQLILGPLTRVTIAKMHIMPDTTSMIVSIHPDVYNLVTIWAWTPISSSCRFNVVQMSTVEGIASKILTCNSCTLSLPTILFSDCRCVPGPAVPPNNRSLLCNWHNGSCYKIANLQHQSFDSLESARLHRDWLIAW